MDRRRSARDSVTREHRVDLFDRWSETYDRSVLDESGVHDGYDDVLETVVRAAGARPGMRVLDLGIGTGNLAWRFVALGCAVWGVDFSPAMLALDHLPATKTHLASASAAISLVCLVQTTHGLPVAIPGCTDSLAQRLPVAVRDLSVHPRLCLIPPM